MKRTPVPQPNHQNAAFMLPTVMIMLGLATIIILSLLQFIVVMTTFTNQIIYRQIALTAAHGALEFGKEQFDGNLSYSGTAETTLFQNSRYRVTYQLNQIPGSLSLDGRSQRMQGIGRVYLPPAAASASYTRVINGEVVRSQIVSKDPSDFSPMAWYDASCNANTSTDPTCQVDTVLKDGSSSASMVASSTREESSAGDYCGGAPATGDGLLSFNRDNECGLWEQQLVGMTFNFGASLPKGTTIQDAYVQFTSGAKADADQVSMHIYGIAADNQPNFTAVGNDQIWGKPLTAAEVVWDPGPWASPNQSGAFQRTPNLKSVIQEIINRPGWNTGNNIALFFEYHTGPGTRRAKMSPITLNLTYSNNVPANTNDLVRYWRDRSGNGFHLSAVNDASRPTKKTIVQNPTTTAPNGKPMISFTPGASAMTATVPANTARASNTYTVFTVMNVLNTTDSVNGTGSILSFWGSGTNNTLLSPLWRHPYSGFHSWDAASGINQNDLCIARDNVERICRNVTNLEMDGETSWAILSMRESITERNRLFRISGTNSPPQNLEDSVIQLNAPYTIAVGAQANNLTQAAGVQIAEIIIYDRELTCPQMEAVEAYLAAKWGFNDPNLPAFNKYQSAGCAENNVPAY